MARLVRDRDRGRRDHPGGILGFLATIVWTFIASIAVYKRHEAPAAAPAD